MLEWIAAGFFVAVAFALVLFREPLARSQALVMGGRIGSGCVIAEAIFIFLLGLAVAILRNALR
jgi:hypothetical protein